MNLDLNPGHLIEPLLLTTLLYYLLLDLWQGYWMGLSSSTGSKKKHCLLKCFLPTFLFWGRMTFNPKFPLCSYFLCLICHLFLLILLPKYLSVPLLSQEWNLPFYSCYCLHFSLDFRSLLVVLFVSFLPSSSPVSILPPE